MKEWTLLDDARVLSLLDKGWTRREIAADFGVTRNAICGKVHRLTSHKRNQMIPADPNAETVAALEEIETGGGEVIDGPTDVAFEEVLAAEPVFESPAPLEADAPRQKTILEIMAALSEVGARGNEGPLGPGGWRITESGRLQIHCRCGTEFLASEETGMGNGYAGYCIGCKKKIFAPSYFDLWRAGKTNRPIQWVHGGKRE